MFVNACFQFILWLIKNSGEVLQTPTRGYVQETGLIIDSTFVEYVENFAQISMEVTLQDKYIKNC